MSSCSKVCISTVEGEVAEHRRKQVKQEAEADTDICNVLHPAFSRSERHKDTVTERHLYIAGKQQMLNHTVKVKVKLRGCSAHRSSSQ